MKEISVYTQKDLDEIERDFNGCINIYGGDWCSPINVSGAWENSSVAAWGNSSVKACGNSTVKARENSYVEARENSSVVACENSHVEAKGNSHVVAKGNSTVIARENSCVEARENSAVKARDNSTAVAWNNSTVEARESSCVEARGISSVEAWENSCVEARDNSCVEACENSCVEARENSCVEARDNSSVEAWENSSVVACENSTVAAWGNSSVEACDNSTVKVWENSSVVACENSHVEAWGNSSVDLGGYAQLRICSDDVNYTTSGCARVILPFDGIDSYINYFGIKEKSKDKIILYKAVRKDDYGVLTSYWDSEFKYEIGKTAHQANIDTDTDEACGVGLHVSTADFALRNYANKEGLAIIECEVPKNKTVVYRFSDGKIRTSELRVLREVPLEELGAYGRIVAKKRKKGGAK